MEKKTYKQPQIKKVSVLGASLLDSMTVGSYGAHFGDED